MLLLAVLYASGLSCMYLRLNTRKLISLTAMGVHGMLGELCNYISYDAWNIS